MINAERDRFIQQHIELYGKELFLGSSSKISKNKVFESSKINLLNNLSIFINDQFVLSEESIESKVIFGSGDPNADLLIIGESPSDLELKYNKPFLGKSGKLLDKILKAIGYNRFSKVYLTHLIKYKIEGSRDPLNSEINKFIPFFKKQIKIIEPKIIISLGKVVGKALINEDLSMDRMRSKVHTFCSYPLKITYSPDALIREKSLKRLAWNDFKFIRDFVK